MATNEPNHLKKKNLIRRLYNQILTALALHAPGSSWRVLFNRLKGATIGENCWIGDHVTLDVHFDHPQRASSLVIGDRVAIGPNCQLFTHDTSYAQITRGRKPIRWGVTEIGSDTWIGPNTLVASARIGKHCIIAPHSVVTKNIPDYSLAMGNPARVVKSLQHIVEPKSVDPERSADSGAVDS